jgi:hypothetical protein
MQASVLLSALAGGLLGIRHAFEPDHLAAVSTLSADQARGKASMLKNAMLGAWWGIGHTAALLIVIAGFSAINATVSPATEQAFELLVAAMLVALGVRAIWRSYHATPLGPERRHQHAHTTTHHHAGGAHVHFGRAGARTLHWRPLLVGSIHGLAGSGALLVLIAARIDSLAGRLLYALTFGLGSVLGMAAMTAASGLMLQRLAQPSQRWLHRGVGACSVVIGLWWATLTLAL